MPPIQNLASRDWMEALWLEPPSPPFYLLSMTTPPAAFQRSGLSLTTADASSPAASDAVPASAPAPQGIALQGTCVTLHAHFYQPPRENPYLDQIEPQPSAAPYADWNERIYWESYRPNAFAQVWNDSGELIEIINNYEYFSFNIGPTLMGWLEHHGREVYDRILEGDRKSRARLGHGNAIAQVYNHIILPLANAADKRTQIRWGKADFARHFGRDPEGMWLAETAIDQATVEALIDEGIRFVILAPSQALRARPQAMPSRDEAWHPAPWQDVSDGSIDPTRPYRCWVGQRFLDVFFYDGPISAAIGFEDLLSSAYNLAERLDQAVKPLGSNGHDPQTEEMNREPVSQLISVATDGETFGHHKMGTEKCAAYAFTREFPRRGWQVTNFAQYLHQQPPTWEVVLKPVTAWSCAHGVGRWQDDCGCARSEHFHQRWRRPLRQALDWLRDQLIPIFVAEAGRLLHKPWQARDEYVEVIGDRRQTAAFLSRHQSHPLSAAEQVRALQLLEMERHTLLMYTSCGWFFEEISRPEGVQILRYAARALELAEEVTGLSLEATFVDRLAQAPSNVEQFGHGAAVYRQLVKPSQFTPEQIAAHWLLESEAATLPSPAERPQVYWGQRLELLESRRCPMGKVALTQVRLRLTSIATWATTELTAIAFQSELDHCVDLQCRVFRSSQLTPPAQQQLTAQLYEAFHRQSPAQFLGTLERVCPPSHAFDLADLRPEVRARIQRSLTAPALERLDQIYNQIYRDHQGVLKHYQRCADPILEPLPESLRAAAHIALSHRLKVAVDYLEQSLTHEPQSIWSGGELEILQTLEAIAQEAHGLRCALAQAPELNQIRLTLERMLLNLLRRIMGDHGQRQQRTREIQLVIRLLLWAERTLKLDLNLMQIQEQFWLGLSRWPQTERAADFQALAKILGVRVPLREADGGADGRS